MMLSICKFNKGVLEMFNFLKPPAAKQQLPQSDVDATYKRLRWQVF